MQNLIVLSHPDDWDLDVPGLQVVQAKDYMTDPQYALLRGVRVFNLARSYRYQRSGYYVSLLATARGHRPLPALETIQDLKSRAMLRLASDYLDATIQRSLAPLQSDEFILSVYFGRNIARRHDRLASALFQHLPAPFLRAWFERSPAGRWSLRKVTSIGMSDILPAHRPFLHEVTQEYITTRSRRSARRTQAGFELAIFADPAEQEPPSNERALKKFVRAGEQLGLAVDLIGPEDVGRIAEYDALFLRETTAVNHRTFRLARRAEALGLVVMDDPTSILKCTNKVFLAELLQRHGVATPRTLIVHKGNVDAVLAELGLPMVLKQPDSAFSRGVVRAENESAYHEHVTRLLVGSDLILAQEFLPTEFDWRIGVIDGKPLFAARYFMAKKHWQIVKNNARTGGRSWGKSDAVPVAEAPPRVVNAAVKAASHIGDGLYGVDVKECNGKPYVIEVNDNPNLDAGCEDVELKDELYLRILSVFLERIRRGKGGAR